MQLFIIPTAILFVLTVLGASPAPVISADSEAKTLIPSATGSNAPIRIPSATDSDAQLIIRVQDLLKKNDLTNAKKLLRDYIETKSKEKQPPFVANQTLYLYFNNLNEILFFQALKNADPKEALELKQKYYPWIFELEKKSPWKEVKFLEPFICEAYDYLAYIAVMETQLDDAIRYLKQAIDIWPLYTGAHAQLAHVYILRNDFIDAKKISQEALDKYTLGDLPNKARLLRHLGYIAIREKQYDLAESYYHQSLEIIPDNPTALAQLKEINNQRSEEK